ncbi:DNA translocase FtsK [Bombus vosnesenskii]|uniref:DNA translocase FtsK n=1 Tax=Bombus vosnesenskii TaxID=207650 RepID=A0A6J3K452_9HYME|nr:DNA translocase FtsK [Bombus vosnesenskii]
MRTVATILLLVAAILVVSAQQYQQPDANYVDEYSAYESPRPTHPTPRSYAANSAPNRQSAGPTTPKPTPVAILKQINRHNEDGSYTYGFEGADGSFKIETKLPTGEVKGKYGFVDDTGKVRVVEYGANQYGFQPAGEGITVAPPTLVDDTTSKEALQAQNYQEEYQQPAARPAPLRAVAPAPAPRPAPLQQIQYGQPAYQQPQTHTEAVYSPQLAPRQQPSLPKPPIFTPAAPQSPLTKQTTLLQPEEPAPPSQLYNQGPAQFGPAPVQEHRSQPQPRSQSGGILDQLARDYALPQGVAPPLHDISFGYY